MAVLFYFHYVSRVTLELSAIGLRGENKMWLARDDLVISSGSVSVMLASSVCVPFRLWCDVIGAKWRRCINVRFEGKV